MVLILSLTGCPSWNHVTWGGGEPITLISQARVWPGRTWRGLSGSTIWAGAPSFDFSAGYHEKDIVICAVVLFVNETLLGKVRIWNSIVSFNRGVIRELSRILLIVWHISDTIRCMNNAWKCMYLLYERDISFFFLRSLKRYRYSNTVIQRQCLNLFCEGHASFANICLNTMR